MKIHHEGKGIILKVALVVVALFLLIHFLFHPSFIIGLLLYLSLFLTLMFTVLFFRVPIRKTRKDAATVISGADGKIVAIEEVMELEYFNDKRLQVSIFMSAFDVHVNFVPVSGKVSYYKYHPGQYFFAWKPKSSNENEHTTIIIKSDQIGEVMIRQIAGAFARRIVCHHRIGDEINQGVELGIIKFGSRIDLIMPLNVKAKVKLNDRVKGGETIIAALSSHF